MLAPRSGERVELISITVFVTRLFTVIALLVYHQLSICPCRTVVRSLSMTSCISILVERCNSKVAKFDNYARNLGRNYART